jgi:hypothetical protein
MEEVEEWRTCVENSNYEVSNLGRVRRATDGYRTYAGRILNPGKNHDGYVYINLQNKCHMVHRLVASAFIGERPEGFEVNHVDNNRSNNSVSNLEYMTHDENVKYSADKGRYAESCVRGEAHRSAKLTEEDVRLVRKIYDAGLSSYYALSKIYGVTKRAMRLVVQRKTWKHVQ